VHAKRNDKDVPQNSRRRKGMEGVARVVLLVSNEVTHANIIQISIEKLTHVN